MSADVKKLAFEKITKAKSRMLNSHPFFSIIALKTPFEENSEHGIPDDANPTMMTDMRRVIYNAEFTNRLSIDEVAGVIMHEVLHIAFLHGFRRNHRDPTLWNFATDYAINLVVKEAGGNLPEPHLYDVKYKNMSAQEIYALLEKDAVILKQKYTYGGSDGSDSSKQDGQGQDKSQGNQGKKRLWGGVIDPKASDGGQASREDEIKIMVQSAAERAKARGTLPASLQGLIEAVGKPKINWKDYIQQWVSGKVPDNYTWVKPNRRILGNFDLYTPSMQLNGSGIGVLSIDTSGSVSDEELREYVREIAGIIEICNPEKLYLIQHDAIIQRIDEWEAGENFKNLKVSGRGGTCIKPVYDHVAKMDEQIDWMICFTDMGICDYPTVAEAPEFPVLWCATGPDNAPFGTYLPLKDAI